jgi:hydrogenase nickel incorporation protein HypA/HybF
MRFCIQLVTAGAPLEGAVLEFDRPEGRGSCRTCEAEFALPDPVLLCRCGSADVEVLAGRELAVASVVLGGGAA